MGRLVGVRSLRVLFKGSALLLCIVLLVCLHTDQEKNKSVTKVWHEGDCSSIMEERVSSKKRSMESTQLISLSSKRKVPKGANPIHNRRSGNGQKPPGKS